MPFERGVILVRPSGMMLAGWPEALAFEAEKPSYVRLPDI